MNTSYGQPKFSCNSGYTFQGSIIKECTNGLVRGERIFCTKTGCKEVQSPKNGSIVSVEGLKAVATCDEGFVLSGNKVTYCNGVNWNTDLGECLRINATVDYSCNFETEDQCGWKANDDQSNPWRRISAANHFHSMRTGPQRDHTFQSDSKGHFIRMETSSWFFYESHFVSPIYPKNLTSGNSLCFKFHVFMYGQNVRDLVVSVKPEKMEIELMRDEYKKNSTKFILSGDHGRQWLSYSIPIDEMQEDFQLIFTATSTNSLFGDIGIDDVELANGDCRKNFVPETTESFEDPMVETTENTENNESANYNEYADYNESTKNTESVNMNENSTESTQVQSGAMGYKKFGICNIALLTFAMITLLLK
ncbi:MAM and LDL-receptor class A domain-containing protein 1-like [Drosophila eugracilis]|uniref:MAM and LDL-receptor class A domain-containing protein 1-like n=1 Tax=Drosophila eugracilis TaxID=29029 RepID=UPI001BDA5574|nr:MAM and LDL-receptor class A domain-containing protein 1-like [Drosophila eugracilis]